MATLKTLNHTSFFCIPASPTVSIYICLDDSWEAKTVDGTPFALATLQCKTKGNSCQWDYILEVDRDQFLIDPMTSLVYDIVDTDIIQLFPYACTLDHLNDASHLLYFDSHTATGTIVPDLGDSPFPRVFIDPSVAGDISVDTAVNGLLGAMVTFWFSNTTGSDVNVSFDGTYKPASGQSLKLTIPDNKIITVDGLVLQPGRVDLLSSFPANAGIFDLDTKATGAYATIDADFGRHIRVDNNVTLLDPVASDVGKEVRIFNTSGGNITISSAAGLTGNVTLATEEARIAYVRAASQYDLL